MNQNAGMMLPEAEKQLLKLTWSAKGKVLKFNKMETLISAYLIEVSGKLLQRTQEKTQAFKGRHFTEKYLQEKSVNRAKVHMHPNKQKKKNADI